MNAETSRRLDEQRPPSLAKLYRDFGDRWEIEQIPRGTQWIAVLRESGGGVVMIPAHDVHALRFKMNRAERNEPEERENASTAGRSN